MIETSAQVSGGELGEKGNVDARSLATELPGLDAQLARPNFEASCDARASINAEKGLREVTYATNVRKLYLFPKGSKNDEWDVENGREVRWNLTVRLR